MTVVDDNDDPDKAHNEDLAEKLGCLPDSRQAQYRAHVDNASENYGDPSKQFRLKLANTLLKNLPVHEESREIHDLNRQEAQRAHLRDQRREYEQPTENTPGTPQRNPGNQIEPIQAEHKISPRDHAPQRLDHRQSQSQRTPSPSSAKADAGTERILSPHELTLMIEHFPDIRREAHILVTRAEIRESTELGRVHNLDQQELEQKQAVQLQPWHRKERDLLDHQQLAERAALQAKWIAADLKAQGLPDAKSYTNDSRSAYHTARVMYQERQNLRSGMQIAREPEQAARSQEQQKQSEIQAAAIGAIELTSEQKANLGPNLKQAIERKERISAKREVTRDDRSQKSPRSPSRPDNSRGGGRSR
jgi:hypothetical protein